MMDSATYLVSEAIAQRSGMIESRYRIADGRFVLNDRDLARVRFTTDEYISGLQGVERVDASYARTLIAQNGFKMGKAKQEESEMVEATPENAETVEEAPVEEDNEEEQEETTE